MPQIEKRKHKRRETGKRRKNVRRYRKEKAMREQREWKLKHGLIKDGETKEKSL